MLPRVIMSLKDNSLSISQFKSVLRDGSLQIVELLTVLIRVDSLVRWQKLEVNDFLSVPLNRQQNLLRTYGYFFATHFPIRTMTVVGAYYLRRFHRHVSSPISRFFRNGSSAFRFKNKSHTDIRFAICCSIKLYKIYTSYRFTYPIFLKWQNTIVGVLSNSRVILYFGLCCEDFHPCKLS